MFYDYEFIEKCLSSDDKYVVFAGFERAKEFTHKYDLFDRWWDMDKKNFKIAACLLPRYGRNYLPFRYIDELLLPYNVDVEYGRAILDNGYELGTDIFNTFDPDLYGEYFSPMLIKKCVNRIALSSSRVQDYLRPSEGFRAWYYSLAGLYAAGLDSFLNAIPYEYIFPYTKNQYEDIREAAVETIRKLGLKKGFIESNYKGLDSSKAGSIGRISWMKIAHGRKDVSLNLAPENMAPDELYFILGLSPVDDGLVKKWSDGSDREKAAAIYCSINNGQLLPEEYAFQILDDDNSPLFLKQAATVLLKKYFREYRTFDPFGYPVYQKCVGDVIVEAEIPFDSQVRGDGPGHRNRASKAIITDIIGDLCERPTAISLEDYKTVYEIGFTIDYRDDFSMGFEEIGTKGFNFYCTLEEAKNAIR